MNLIFVRATLIPHAEDLKVDNLVESIDNEWESDYSFASELKKFSETRWFATFMVPANKRQFRDIVRHVGRHLV